METYVDIIKNIQNNFNNLSKGQKLIAEFIINNYDKAAFMTAASLGETVNVSESTVVRFANTLGYRGYRELQKDLHELIKNKLTTVQRLTMVNEYSNRESALKKAMEKDMENIDKTINEIGHKTFQEAIDLILSAENIYILGLRSSSFLAGYLGFYLSFLIKGVKVITSGPNDVFEQLLKADSKDLIIGISYPRYSKRTLEALDFCVEKGCKIISITDSLISPAAKYADISLIASSDMLSFVDSLVAPMSLINALIVAIGMEKKNDIRSSFEDLENIWKKYNVYDAHINGKDK
ncbi:MurR/RpiR family transcriptional regulator [Tissierella praeacuta]|uniref:Transcriptional regulator, RpiR family n=1 Tax=Tissierella praeacuta DSM 18095 TaxID=1123404 RepID=A0A1M4SFB1_9FIRM|nr:MurR/RpiR family transcriptional regulator [Tissierella praeacuta]HAE92731.1 MurR/RpiR family transcriptional regulator [Tissierella sp.]MBU5254845.1 MurR/RpiR family transcriptional regulator [Tissierella praeacuta]TCU72743.1 RpiR family transcriptional regulator [Tissierella praeacuta]SHE30954.1 transcriptional regulator, RpiR family [Tissierella praeacuta DSM 18095]SUP01377.1 MurPQ operon repressor [Tissierella praeacuta]